MIEIPKSITPTVTVPTSTSTAGENVQFHAVKDEEKPPIVAIKRRRNPSRRKPSAEKHQIERRVSSDRRRSTFSSKA